MDSIADMINSLKMGAKAGKPSVLVPHSNIKMAIAKLLEEEGFIKSVVKAGKKNRKFIQCDLIYAEGAAKINGVKRVSKPSRRVYVQTRELPRLRGNKGMAVISTPSGLKTAKAAMTEKVGGEVLFTIWS